MPTGPGDRCGECLHCGINCHTDIHQTKNHPRNADISTVAWEESGAHSWEPRSPRRWAGPPRHGDKLIGDSWEPRSPRRWAGPPRHGDKLIGDQKKMEATYLVSPDEAKMAHAIDS
ncbi:uncharacterized protein A4U43_C01F1590 [Asparagus officinalis]|uniref:Uncharacterized protein n=1 Tax=Asparagus officinalis TaxID=4686 RepID=A0A5P1FKX7_ASPOF|nr:uncharacterized protein A4U43_C01F1590 [Asparagus officinalis]